MVKYQKRVFSTMRWSLWIFFIWPWPKDAKMKNNPLFQLSLTFKQAILSSLISGCFKSDFVPTLPPEDDTQQQPQHSAPPSNNNNIWSNYVTSSTSTITSTESDDKRKIHKCDFPTCDKVYTKSSHLKAHKRYDKNLWTENKQFYILLQILYVLTTWIFLYFFLFITLVYNTYSFNFFLWNIV